ncbi:hypothetical protein ACA910_007933 [Epithemia clementina (nom. ined.)]
MSRFGKEEWTEFNDSQTRRISDDTLRKNQSAAYLLFYNRRRIDPTGSPGNHKVMGNDPTITPGKSRHSRHHHEVTRIPLVRRQSINRPDLGLTPKYIIINSENFHVVRLGSWKLPF